MASPRGAPHRITTASARLRAVPLAVAFISRANPAAAAACFFCPVPSSSIAASRASVRPRVISSSAAAAAAPAASTAAATVMGAALDDELSTWASGAGYGEVTSSETAGSSGWASFRRVEVSDPPSPGASFFVKSSGRSSKEMFEGEALGLRAMFECSRAGGSSEEGGGADSLRIPEVYHWGDYTNGGGSFLVMEYLALAGRSDDGALGRAVARMHLANPTKLPSAGNSEGKFGFNVDNTIGGTPQPNDWTDGGTSDDWVKFFRDERIGHQLDLAGDAYCSKLWTKDIAPRLGALFDDVDVKPSMLHGDLWSGNIGSANGSPSIFDPACYWGHHEAEWGMSWCASFGRDFWDGYRSILPEDPGFNDRKPLYDAYHQLNHYNLFGGGYLSSARGDLEALKRTLDKLGA